MATSSEPQVQVPAEIDIIKLIFTRLESGHAYNNIANELNENGVKSPRGSIWRAKTIREIASNPLHAGVVVTGRTRRKMNPLVESFYTEKMPPDEWTWTSDISLSPYKIIEPERWIAIQRRINMIAEKSKRRGKPQATFGPSILSGMLFCWHCGAPLVNGRGGKNRYFRCSKRRLKIGNPERCNYTFSIKENEFLKILTCIIKDVLHTIVHDGVRIFNEELKGLQDNFSPLLSTKKDEYRKIKKRENTLIDLIEHAKSSGQVKLFEYYYEEISKIRERVLALEREIERLEDAYSFSKKPIEINNKIFIDQLNKIEKMLTESTDPDAVRSAIKKFLPKIFIRIDDEENDIRKIVFRIDELPPNIPDFLHNTHECIVRYKQKNHQPQIVNNYEKNVKNPFNAVYEYLADTY
jgi:hypothetical protein